MPFKDIKTQREYQKKWIAKRRADWFVGKNCIDCGSVDELELDHIDRSEKVDHRIWSWSLERIAIETNKCEVRCKTCHKKRTKSQMTLPTEHGTHNGYAGLHKCRCELCTEAQKLYNQKWRSIKHNKKEEHGHH